MQSPDNEPSDQLPEGEGTPGSPGEPGNPVDPRNAGEPGNAGATPNDDAELTAAARDDAAAAEADAELDALPTDETVWELPHPVASAWVGFWPHPDPPTREEVGRAIASWVGKEIETEASEADEDEGMLWALMANVPGVTAPVVLWAEAALPADPGQLPDSAMARCKWVVGMQTVLEPGEAHAEFFHLMSMLAGALPEITGILDVSNARRWPREELEEQFLAADAVPNDEFLWTITAVATAEDDDSPMMLFTTGLTRCGLPELEMLEVPSRHSQAAAILTNHVASLLLEAPPPAPGTPIEVGPEISVALVPWQECARYMQDETPGSRSFREVAREQGDGSLMSVRAVISASERRGTYRKLWAWPKEIIDRMEDGRAVLYASEHSAAATERRAQRTWPKFATAYASVRRSEEAGIRELAETAFHVQAPLGTVDAQDRREQGWFVVRAFDHDEVDAALSEEPVTPQDIHVGDRIRLSRSQITDWRVILPEEMYGPDRSDALLAAIDRLRGLA